MMVVAQVRSVSPGLEQQFDDASKTRKNQFITNGLDCDPSIRRHRTRALPKR
jgi:hypothetical protein